MRLKTSSMLADGRASEALCESADIVGSSGKGSWVASSGRDSLYH